MSDQSLGVVLFDDPAIHASGWAMKQGGRVTRIQSTADLGANTVWLTNLDYPHYGSSGLSRSPRFRGARFFRTSIKALLKEVGLYTAPPKERLAFLMHLFPSVLRCAADLGVPVAPPETLARGFRELTMGRRYGYQGAAEVREAIEHASQPYTFCESPPWTNGDRVLTVVRSRPAHCQDLLARPVPNGTFRSVPLSRLPQDHASLVEYERPLLLRVRIDRFDTQLSGLLNHGAGALHVSRQTDKGTLSTANDRHWVSHPEFDLLRRHSDIEVIGALEADAYGANPFKPPALTTRKRLSPAYGLACESYWSAAVRTLNGRIDPSPLSVWMQAFDRVICLEGALSILSRFPDAIIQHYGSGRITLRVHDDGRYLSERLCYALADSDWLPPIMRDQIHERFPVPEPPTPADILRVLAMRGRVDALSEMDHALFTTQEAERGRN